MRNRCNLNVKRQSDKDRKKSIRCALRDEDNIQRYSNGAKLNEATRSKFTLNHKWHNYQKEVTEEDFEGQLGN